MTQEPSRHVIFLGAGASKSSGYPLGDSLRLRLSCRKRFQKELSISSGIGTDESARISSTLFKTFGKSIDLFRNGGFATVDEFSKLASSNYPLQAQEMKTLMRVALAFHNPEENFEESDYYPFIQRLFRDDDLRSLKSHITVISYNYDCYLDFLLLRAFTHRNELAEGGANGKFEQNKLTSGFYYKEDLSWAEQTLNFNYFKLHGSITDNPAFHHPHFFAAQALERLIMLQDEFHTKVPPPIVFPWELFDSMGKFASEKEFVFVKNWPTRHAEGNQLYNLYKTIWASAKEAVSRARKISFVGLSGHTYMEEGLAFLLGDIRGEIQVVVANPENANFKDSKNRLHPASLCGRVSQMLQRVAPKMKYVKSMCEDDGIINMTDFENVKAENWEPDITPRYSFKEFIQTEMV